MGRALAIRVSPFAQRGCCVESLHVMLDMPRPPVVATRQQQAPTAADPTCAAHLLAEARGHAVSKHLTSRHVLRTHAIALQAGRGNDGRP